MMSMYVAPMGMGGDKKELESRAAEDARRQADGEGFEVQEDGTQQGSNRVKDPLTFLYYSVVLTTLTVICAIVIGITQLLSLILNVANPTGPFWDGVQAAGDNYEYIGGGICASFIVAGLTSVLLHGRFKRWVSRKRAMLPQGTEVQPYRDDLVRGSPGMEQPASRGCDEEEVDVIEEVIEIDGKAVGGSNDSERGIRIGQSRHSGEASGS
jgi:hypothetical protein